MKKSFILHHDTLNVLDELTDEQAGKLFKAIFNYHIGNDIVLDFGLKMAFLPFKNQFKRDEVKYLSICDRNQKNGQKGGRPKNEAVKKNPKNPVGYLETQPNPKNLDSDSDSDSDSENDSENDSEKVKENKYIDFLSDFNSITKRKFRVLDDKTKRQLKARLKEGFTIDEIKTAITNCKADEYHIEFPKYLTPEFITRAEKLQKYLNIGELKSNIIYEWKCKGLAKDIGTKEGYERDLKTQQEGHVDLLKIYDKNTNEIKFQKGVTDARN